MDRWLVKLIAPFLIIGDMAFITVLGSRAGAMLEKMLSIFDIVIFEIGQSAITTGTVAGYVLMVVILATHTLAFLALHPEGLRDVAITEEPLALEIITVLLFLLSAVLIVIEFYISTSYITKNAFSSLSGGGDQTFEYMLAIAIPMLSLIIGGFNSYGLRYFLQNWAVNDAKKHTGDPLTT